ncbi:DUF1835 domain-containing protein [Radiobacillus sp. PE A8.2]|uniref:DUF1835 domain-containing protein n=1 Tax=Radiobacillus sp. PE A8.2 TaxID=3380349 RepID=UPI00388DEB92
MIDELKRLIGESDDDEVKTLLLLILLRIQMLEEKNQYSEDQLILDLKKIYHDFLNVKSEQESSVNLDPNYKAVHIVFGDSAASSVKMALKEMKLQDEENVIFFSDLL